jgi:hypothetical protein
VSSLVELQSDLPPLRDPVLIAGFAVRRRAGRLPSTTVTYLIDEWQAQPLAKLGPDPFYDLSVRRPESHYEGDKRVIDWPEATLYLARPAGATRDFLLLVGLEPNFYWRTFVEALSGYLDRLGGKTVITLRAFPAPMPHTRPAPVMLQASDIELELQFGVQSADSKYEGPTDIGGVLSASLQSLRWRTVDLTALQPDYIPRMPYARASMALIALIDQAFGTSTPLGSLQEVAAEQTLAIDQILAVSEDARSLLPELERRYDEGVEKLDFLVTSSDPPSAADLPSSEEAIEEVERWFREGDNQPNSPNNP